MFDAQLLTGQSTTYSVYSPWFPREADSAICTLDVVEIHSADITVRVFTKNAEDTGDGTDADSSVTINTNTAGRTSAEWLSTASVGFKELVRFKYTIAEDSLAPGEVAWALFRMLPIVWFDSVQA